MNGPECTDKQCAPDSQCQVYGKHHRIEHSISVRPCTENGRKPCDGKPHSTIHERLARIAGLEIHGKVSHGGHDGNEWEEEPHYDADNVDVLDAMSHLERSRVEGKLDLPEEKGCVKEPPYSQLHQCVCEDHACKQESILANHTSIKQGINPCGGLRGGAA